MDIDTVKHAATDDLIDELVRRMVEGEEKNVHTRIAHKLIAAMRKKYPEEVVPDG